LFLSQLVLSKFNSSFHNPEPTEKYWYWNKSAPYQYILDSNELFEILELRIFYFEPATKHKQASVEC